jgi:5S rRNA maturation endonuclease (ribonuclease M5)
MKQAIKESYKAHKVERLLFDMKSSFVIVEGKHDLNVLNKLGIKSYTYESVMRGVNFPKEKAILMMDLDRRGVLKAEMVSSILLGENIKVDNKTGRSLLFLLNTTHVEGILAPVGQLFKIEK